MINKIIIIRIISMNDDIISTLFLYFLVKHDESDRIQESMDCYLDLKFLEKMVVILMMKVMKADL